MPECNRKRKNTGHFESADPAMWVESRASTINRRDSRPKQLDQLTSMARIFIADNITLPFFIVSLLWGSLYIECANQCSVLKKKLGGNPFENILLQ